MRCSRSGAPNLTWWLRARKASLIINPCFVQAAALPQLCSQLRLAKGLRELVLELQGSAAGAVPAKLASISCLTQLDSLQLNGIGNRVQGKHVSAAVRPLTRLTRLGLRFVYNEEPDDAASDADEDGDDEQDSRTTFPWASAVSRLINLQELRFTADIDPDGVWGASVKGALPAALTSLSSLRQLTVVGLDTYKVHDNRDQPLLPALPALETAALELHTLSNVFPGLGQWSVDGPDPAQQVVLSRVVSLRLALQYNAEAGQLYDSTLLPTIVAPALTELSLGGMWLQPDSSELSWLPGLPKLRRLVLTDIETQSAELPKGVTACSGITELLLDGFKVSTDDGPVLLRHLPRAGPYLSKLVRLGLPRNEFSSVPPSLAAATALELLDMSGQQISAAGCACLKVLDRLPRLRGVILGSFKGTEDDIRRFRASHPNVTVSR